MPRTTLRALAVALLLIPLAACGNGKASASEVKAKIATEITKEGLDKKTAGCFAGVLIDEIGVDKLRKINFSEAEPMKDIQDEYAAAAIKALTKCDVDMRQLSK